MQCLQANLCILHKQERARETLRILDEIILNRKKPVRKTDLQDWQVSFINTHAQTAKESTPILTIGFVVQKPPNSKRSSQI